MAMELQQLPEEKEPTQPSEAEAFSRIKGNEWKQSGDAQGKGLGCTGRALVIQTHFPFQTSPDAVSLPRETRQNPAAVQHSDTSIQDPAWSSWIKQLKTPPDTRHQDDFLCM